VENKNIIIIPYEDMDFIWISDHWDYHLSGLCRYDSKLCRFRIAQDPYKDHTAEYKIYGLSIIEKLIWIKRKKLFEWCIGYHWTYPMTYTESSRTPKWFWKIVFRLYYKEWNLNYW